MEKINSLLVSAEKQIAEAREILFGKQIAVKAKDLPLTSDSKNIEGIFDGEIMVDSKGVEYPIPANYASKSKLVPGDVLKLTILPDGTFMFKQIGPVPRKKLIGGLTEEDGEYFVEVEDQKYKVLRASITYFKAEPGDKITIIVPEGTPAEYAAVENVIKGL